MLKQAVRHLRRDLQIFERECECIKFCFTRVYNYKSENYPKKTLKTIENNVNVIERCSTSQETPVAKPDQITIESIQKLRFGRNIAFSPRPARAACFKHDYTCSDDWTCIRDRRTTSFCYNVKSC